MSKVWVTCPAGQNLPASVVDTAFDIDSGEMGFAVQYSDGSKELVSADLVRAAPSDQSARSRSNDARRPQGFFVLLARP